VTPDTSNPALRSPSKGIATHSSEPNFDPPRVALKPTTQDRVVPDPWRDSIDSILISKTELRVRVQALAAHILQDYQQKDLVIVALLNGTVVFLADLLRELPLRLRLDFIGVSSYRTASHPGDIRLTKELQLDIAGRDVLIVDDILDTGNTLSHVAELLARLEPQSLRSCVLLDKPSRRATPWVADYVGFEIPDAFVVGYGLDYAQEFRNVPFIGVLRPESR